MNASDYVLSQLEGEQVVEEEKFPVHSEDLLKELEDRYPERLPYSDESERDFAIYLGTRALIRNLQIRQFHATGKKGEKKLCVSVRKKAAPLLLRLFMLTLSLLRSLRPQSKS